MTALLISQISQIHTRLCHLWDGDGSNDDSNSSNTAAAAMMTMAAATTTRTMAAGTGGKDSNQLKAAVTCSQL
jgi:hypothetical protein